MDGQSKTSSVFHAAQVQDLGARGGHFQHFLTGDLVDLLSAGDHSRIGRVHAVDVCVDLANVSVQGGGQCNSCGVGTAAAHGGDLVGCTAHALETGNNGHLALVQGGAHAVRVHIDDAGLAVNAIGNHAGLAACEGLGHATLRANRHGQQGHGNTLTGGHEHVQLAGRGMLGDLGGQIQQLIGGVTHG